ncbi:MAG: hypothetical protein GY749_09840 [Desulfobacteraceae bacterium]|nr:hypothetical protein [Desulfobacteraceae bacterium]
MITLKSRQGRQTIARQFMILLANSNLLIFLVPMLRVTAIKLRGRLFKVPIGTACL